MTKLYTLLIFLFLVFPSHGRYYKWVTGGGSNGAIQNQEEVVTHMCTDDNGNVYVLSQVGDNQITADSFYLPKAFNVGVNGYLPHILFTSYDCEGNMRFAKLIEAKNIAFPTGVVYSNGKIYVSGLMIGNKKRIGYDD